MSVSLGPNQAQFVSTLARETGLNPHVVAAWATAEQSGSAARNYEGKNYNNFLNIANTDSGPKGGAHSAVWMHPESAAKATAAWLKGQGQIAKEYGAPAQGIRNILNTRGQGPEQQIQAISKSGWASSGYNGGSTLRSLMGEINPSQIPAQEPKASTSPAPGLPGQPTPQFDQAAYTKASTGATVGKLFSPAERQNNPLFTTGTLTTKEPAKSEFTTTAPGKAAAPPGVSPPGYAPAGSEAHAGGKLGGLLPANATLKLGRIDEGQDGQTTPGGAIVANGKGTVVGVKSDPGGFGPSYPLVEFSTGPLAGLGPIYFGHTLAAVKVGQRVSPGTVISHTGTSGVGNATVPGWFEIGLGNTLGQGNTGQGAKIAPHLR
jgi:hypothetical protein